MAAAKATTKAAVKSKPAKASVKAAPKAPAKPRSAVTAAASKPASAKAAAPRASAKSADGKASASGTVTLRQIAASIAEEHEMPKRQADQVLSNVVAFVVKHLKKGDRVRIGGLGILQVKKRAARMGRNPATGEAIKIKASKKVAFRASKELKEAI